MAVDHRSVHKALCLQPKSDTSSRSLTSYTPEKTSLTYASTATSDNPDQTSSDDLKEKKRKRFQQLESCSKPYAQFRNQKNFKQERLGNPPYTLDKDHPLWDREECAFEIVKRDWISQGIWDDNWGWMFGWWKHQQPSNSCSDNCVKSFEESPQQSESERARELTAQDASRPQQQFRHQVQREREYILEHNHTGTSSSMYKNELRWNLTKEDTREDVVDEISHHVVRNRWIKQGIWYSGWGQKPGLQWMDEMSWEDVKGDDAVTTEQYDLSRYDHPDYESSAPWPKHFHYINLDRGPIEASENESLPSHRLPTPPKSPQNSPSWGMQDRFSSGDTPLQAAIEPARESRERLGATCKHNNKEGRTDIWDVAANTEAAGADARQLSGLERTVHNSELDLQQERETHKRETHKKAFGVSPERKRP